MDLSVRDVPLVQAGDPKTLVRWLARIPRHVGNGVFVLGGNKRVARQKNIIQCRSWYARNEEYAKGQARARYHADVEKARARLRERYKKRAAEFRKRERERHHDRKIATAILLDVLAWLEVRG